MISQTALAAEMFHGRFQFSARSCQKTASAPGRNDPFWCHERAKSTYPEKQSKPAIATSRPTRIGAMPWPRVTMDLSDISELGLSHVTVFLDQRRFNVKRMMGPDGSTHLEASSKTQRLLVRVQAALHPASPASLSDAERRHVADQAGHLGLEAWQAGVTVDKSGHLTRNIRWTRLS